MLSSQENILMNKLSVKSMKATNKNDKKEKTKDSFNLDKEVDIIFNYFS